MKEKRSLLQSFKKDINKGLRRIYWYNYTKIKYFYYLVSSYLFHKKTKSFEISLLLPSRERSKKFLRLINSIKKTCFLISRIEILLLLDSDDNEIEEYKRIIASQEFTNLNIRIIFKNLNTHAERNNYLATKSLGKILFPINDDIIFETKSWDLEIDKVFSKFDSGAFCLWTNTGQKYNYLHCDFPIINKEWFGKLGYVGSEYFKFWYLDTWICDLCFLSKKFLVTDKIKIYQFSAHTIITEVDKTHLKNLSNDIPKKDLITWQNTKKYRITDAKKLK